MASLIGVPTCFAVAYIIRRIPGVSRIPLRDVVNSIILVETIGVNFRR